MFLRSSFPESETFYFQLILEPLGAQMNWKVHTEPLHTFIYCARGVHVNVWNSLPPDSAICTQISFHPESGYMRRNSRSTNAGVPSRCSRQMEDSSGPDLFVTAIGSSISISPVSFDEYMIMHRFIKLHWEADDAFRVEAGMAEHKEQGMNGDRAMEKR